MAMRVCAMHLLTAVMLSIAARGAAAGAARAPLISQPPNVPYSPRADDAVADTMAACADKTGLIISLVLPTLAIPCPCTTHRLSSALMALITSGHHQNWPRHSLCFPPLVSLHTDTQ